MNWETGVLKKRSRGCRVGFKGLNLRRAEVGVLAPEPRSKGALGRGDRKKETKEFGQRLGWLIGEFEGERVWKMSK